MKLLQACLIAIAAALCAGAAAEPVRLKDLGRFNAWRDNALIGYGLVTGLSGTGDSARNKATRQSLANLLSRFDVTVASDEAQSRNVALVMVTARLSSHARPGDRLDVTVSSAGDARSLAGGVLLLTPLKGPDGHTYALAQGPLTVGGFRHDAKDNLVQKNHPTVGIIDDGATVEANVDVPEWTPQDRLVFVLHEPDFTTAGRVADAINGAFPQSQARVRDGNGIDVRLPQAAGGQVAAFVRSVEGLSVVPDRSARVVINERTGTIVAGGDVRISKVAVSHGDIKVTVTGETSVSQPSLLGRAGGGVRTAVITNNQLAVEDNRGARFVPAGATRVADLVQTLARMKASTQDIIAVLQAVKAAGALHAELVVQ